MNTKFLLLCPADNSKLRAEWTSGKNEVERITCPINQGHARPGRRLSPLDVSLSKLPGERSLVWTWYGELLASQAVVDLLRVNGFTGFNAIPAIVRTRRAEMVRTAFFELCITGWGGLPARESGIRRIQHCPGCNLSIYSCFDDGKHLIDVDQWDGSDFFFVWPAPRFLFVPAGVVEMLTREKISGWAARELAEVNCSSQLTPGALDCWLPLDKIDEIRARVGPDGAEFFD